MNYFKRTDILIILVVLAVSGISWWIYQQFSAEKQAVAEIYYYSELAMTVDLNKNEDRRFSIPQDENVVFHLYEDGSIAFEDSDCPDKVCIRAGRIKSAGQFAACLPNGIVMKIVPVGDHDKDDADIVIGQ